MLHTELSLKQLRAARALLGWTQSELATLTGMSTNALNAIERGAVQPRVQNLQKLFSVFEQAGVEFIDQSGVRLRADRQITVEGRDAVAYLFNDICETLHNTHGIVRIFGIDDDIFIKEEPEALPNYLKRAEKLGLHERVIVEKNDRSVVTMKNTEYRWVANEYFTHAPFFIYGDRLAYIFWQPVKKIIIFRQLEMAESFRKMFDFMWEQAEKPTKI